MASNNCELFLWQDKGNLFRRGHTFDGILHWMPQCGGKYGMLWFLSTIMFLYRRQLEVLTPQIWRHHIFRFTFYNMSNFLFSERTYFDGTPTSKIWLCGTEKLKVGASHLTQNSVCVTRRGESVFFQWKKKTLSLVLADFLLLLYW